MLKFLHAAAADDANNDDDDDPVISIARLFLRNRRAKNGKCSKIGGIDHYEMHNHTIIDRMYT